MRSNKDKLMDRTRWEKEGKNWAGQKQGRKEEIHITQYFPPKS